MRSGDRPGLQNRRSLSRDGDGGFDSHSLPPIGNALDTPTFHAKHTARSEYEAQGELHEARRR
jgi:hypothetical protein